MLRMPLTNSVSGNLFQPGDFPFVKKNSNLQWHAFETFEAPVLAWSKVTALFDEQSSELYFLK